MAEDVYMQHLRGNFAESAASTLTEFEIPTGASIAGMLKAEAIALEMKEIVTMFDTIVPADAPAANAIESIRFAISTISGLTSIPNIDDVDCIYLRYSALHAGVATYLPQILIEGAYPAVWEWKNPLLIPHPKIYGYIISTNASVLARVRYSIGFTYVSLTGPEVMEALEIWRNPV